MESISRPSLPEQRADGGAEYRPEAQKTSSLRSPGSCRRVPAAAAAPEAGQAGGHGAASPLRRWHAAPASTAREGDALRARPPRRGKGSISGRLPQASKPEQNRHISSFARAYDLNPFLGQRTDGGDVSPPPPPSVPEEEAQTASKMRHCHAQKHTTSSPRSPRRGLAGRHHAARSQNPQKINVLIKPGKRQADYSPAPSQGRAGENKPVLIVLAAPPLPLQSPTRFGKPRRALCSHRRRVNPPRPGKAAHVPVELK